MPLGAGGFDQVGVRAVVQGFGPYMAQMGQMEKKTQGFGSRVGAALKAGSMVGGAALVGLAAISIKTFADFDSAMTKSLAIMGDVSGEMESKMSKAARDVAKTTTFSATQAADSYFYLASAGLDAAASIKAMPKVAAFAQAGMFDMALATDLATDAQSALGLTIRDDAVKNVKNLVKVTDVLVKANTLANATVEQFSKSLTTKAGAALKFLNKDVEEGVAVLAAFADQGVKGQMAGERLSIVLRDLMKASIDNREEFNSLNISVFDSEGKLRNLADIIGELERALGPLSDEQKKVTLGMLGFQEESQASLLTLMGTSDAIRIYEAELRNAGGTTEEVAKKQLQTFSAQMTLLWHKVQDVFIVIGSKLVPMLLTLAKVLENDVVPVVKGFFAAIVDVGGWLVRNKELVGILAAAVLVTLVPAIVAWTAAAWANVTAQIAQTVAMAAASPVVLAIVASLAVLGAAYLATDKQGQRMARNMIREFGKVSAEVYSAVLGPFGIDPMFGRVVSRIEEMEAAAKDWNELQNDAAKASAKWAEQTVADMQAMSSEGKELGLSVEQIELAQLEKLAQEMRGISWFVAKDQQIGPIWSAAMEEVLRSSGLTADEVDGLVNRIVEVRETAGDAGEAIRDELTAAIEDMKLPSKEAKDALIEIVGAAATVPEPVDEAAEAFNTFKEGVDTAMEGAGKAIQGLLPTIDEEFAAWQERLAETAQAYANFQTNLETILGGLLQAQVEQPELIIQALAEAGPEVTQAMATHLAENPVAAVDETLANLGVVVGTNVDAATDEVLKKAAAFEAEMGTMATESVAVVDQVLWDQLGPAVGINVDAAGELLKSKSPVFQALMGALAANSVRAAGLEWDQLGPAVGINLDAVGVVVRRHYPTFREEMWRLSQAGIAGFKKGWTDGGLEGWTQQQFTNLEAAARKFTEAYSPSKVFMRLGEDIRLGLVAGMSGGSQEPGFTVPAPSVTEIVPDTMLRPQPSPVAATSATVSLEQHFHGKAEPEVVREAARDGVDIGLRKHMRLRGVVL